MAFFLRTVIDQWVAYGYFDVLLPLILMFALVFAILQRTKILGESKQLNSVVAFIISLFFVLNPAVTSWLPYIFSQAGLALIVMVAVMILVGLFMGKDEMPLALRWVGAVGGIALFLWLLTFMTGYYPIYMWFPFSDYWWATYGSGVLAAIILLVGIGIIFVSSKTGGTPTPPQRP